MDKIEESMFILINMQTKKLNNIRESELYKVRNKNEDLKLSYKTGKAEAFETKCLQGSCK